MKTPPPVQTVSHYRLLELLGRGAMGEVWLAEDLQLPRRVAIKLLPRHLAEDPEAVERLLREARTAASVDHPHVVTVHEAGLHDGQPYLVMQRVEGETLERRLARGPLTVPEAVALAAAIADALAEVHALGIVHRDLKPANIVITSRGPKVLDFGLAAVRGAARLTAQGVAVGTPLFMSPEQIRAQPPDNRSDLWALGAILYQALTGVRPFEGANWEAVVERILHEKPPAPSQHNPAVGPKLDALVEKLLRKEAGLRYGRAEDLLVDLASCSEGTESTIAWTLTQEQPAPVPRLAVLDFEVLSADPDDSFIARGLTEDLIVDLARVEGLRVAARGEVLPYRDRDVPTRTIAREIGVEYLVQGSVRRAGPRARISAQLVRAHDGHAVWAERFDRTLDDLFAVQAEVSKRIVDALQVKLQPTERALLDRAPARNQEAYAFYLRGRALIEEDRRESNQRAVECFRQAITLDPDFALAHATLAQCYARQAMAWWAGLEVAALARPHAQRALEIDPELPDGHLALALIHRLENDPQGVLAEIGRAQSLDPSNRQLTEWVAKSLMALGRPAEAVTKLEQACRIHPEDWNLLSALSDCYDMLHRDEDLQRSLVRIRELLVKTLDREPDNIRARGILGIALAQCGEHESALVQIERAIAAAPDDCRVRYNAACALAQMGLSERAIAELQQVERLLPSYLSDWPRHDPDLVSLHEHPEFIRMFGRTAPAHGAENVPPATGLS